MSRFVDEPVFVHGTRSAALEVGVLLLNLGTPEAPTPQALRVYLREFLSDPRVIEIPPIIWKVILHAFILPFRPKRSAKKYASIWTDQGSPLMSWTQQQSALLQEAFNLAGHRVEVAYAMRYGQPSVETVLNDLRSRCRRILILPLYPQYAGSSTATAVDKVMSCVQRMRNQPELRFIRSFYDETKYINALAQRVRAQWELRPRAEMLVMSFHGVPRRTLELGDPYYCECMKTGRLLAQALGLAEGEYKVTFQSRFGKATWLQPYTEATIRELAHQGTKSVEVICPGFVSDCLETLEEIAMEVKAVFLEEGGQSFYYIPALNAEAVWIDALRDICLQNLQGWATERSELDAIRLQRESDAQRQASRIKELGGVVDDIEAF